jgi:hypothetical protein
MNKRIVMLLLLLLSIIPSLPVHAQEVLQYGSLITAEMTNEQFEFNYTFDGKVNDVVVIAIKAVDPLGEFYTNILTLKNEAGEVLAEYRGFSRNEIFTQLPESATYTITVTRPDGAAGTDVGEFTLSIDSIPLVEIGASLSDTISSEGNAHYYAYSGDTDFYISYSKSAGDFFPEVSVNTIGVIDNDGQLSAVGSMSGGMFVIGSIGTFTGGRLYIIEVDEALFDFNFSEVTADYTIDIVDAAKLQ